MLWTIKRKLGQIAVTVQLLREGGDLKSIPGKPACTWPLVQTPGQWIISTFQDTAHTVGLGRGSGATSAHKKLWGQLADGLPGWPLITEILLLTRCKPVWKTQRCKHWAGVQVGLSQTMSFCCRCNQKTETLLSLYSLNTELKSFAHRRGLPMAACRTECPYKENQAGAGWLQGSDYVSLWLPSCQSQRLQPHRGKRMNRNRTDIWHLVELSGLDKQTDWLICRIQRLVRT